MATDVVLTRDGPVSVPMDYVVPAGGELQPVSVRATVDGTSAAGTFYAVVQIIAPSGRIMGSFITAAVAAGASVDATWFPWRRGVGAAAPSPAPSPTGTLFAWYDFADTSTITTDGSGKIVTIKDKSGNGHDCTQGTSANRPSETTVNSLNAGLFSNSVQTWLEASPFTAVVSQPITVCAVASLTTGTGSGTIFPHLWGGSRDTNQTFMFLSGNYTADILSQADGGGSHIDSGQKGTFPQWLFSAQFNGASSYLRVNGGQTNGSLLSNGMGGITLGWSFQGIGGENDYWNGAICELLFFTGNLSAAQLTGNESYLKSKWATP